MSTMSAAQLKLLIVRTRQRYREIDHADWDGRRYRTPDTRKWEQAAVDVLRTANGVHPAEWAEFVRILAQGWDYYGGSDLPGDGSVTTRKTSSM
jgi:hypothetical protein